MGKYEAQENGGWLAVWKNRKKIYSGAVVVGGIVIAACVTIGLITLQDVQDFIATTGAAVGVLAGVGMMLQGALARRNPPEGEDA